MSMDAFVPLSEYAELEAENQRLRDALDTTVEWAQEQGYDQLVERLDKALAGDAE